MTGHELHQLIEPTWPDILLPPYPADIIYHESISVKDMLEMHSKYRYGFLGYAPRYHAYKKESWDCDDYALSFVVFVKEQYCKTGKSAPVFRLKVPNHSLVAWVCDGEIKTIDGETGQIVIANEAFWAECV